MFFIILLYRTKIVKCAYMEIDLDKIISRVPTIDDAKEHFFAVQDSYKEASEFLPEFVGMEHWTIPQHENYLKKFSSATPDIKNLMFFYEGKIVGVGHLFPSGWKKSGELIYWVRTGYEGLGIGEHIARTMAAKAAANFGYRWIVIQTDRNNVASKKVAEKVGGAVMLIYGYYDHRGKQSNMLVWAIPTTFGKFANMYSKDPYFDPINPKFDGHYRIDYEGRVANYAAADPGRYRKK